ncbi:MAG: twin-arginine translocation signal domain-containing protein, partial [Pseudomonadota bacterium]|nr:twin-arginine translocation signal domain-containing protein [Pseudomonadota bacterium]
MASVNRRDFFKFVGAGGVGAGAGYLYAELVKRPQELLIPQVIPPEDYSPGLATWYNTVCNQCSGGCGISVRVREGEAKKIEGNPVHPINQGRLCALGQSGLNALYNPDRLKTPLRNNSGGKFQGIEWKEAIDELAQKLGESSARGQNDRVQLLTGNIRGHVNELIGHFM